MNFIKERLLSTREGQIVFWGSVVYIILFATSKTIFTERAWFSFILLMSGYMPLFLFGFYFKMGGFKNSYKSNNFNAVGMGVIAIIPLIITASNYFN